MKDKNVSVHFLMQYLVLKKLQYVSVKVLYVFTHKTDQVILHIKENEILTREKGFGDSTNTSELLNKLVFK